MAFQKLESKTMSFKLDVHNEILHLINGLKISMHGKRGNIKDDF